MLITFAFGGGLFWLTRRRGTTADGSAPSADGDTADSTAVTGVPTGAEAAK